MEKSEKAWMKFKLSKPVEYQGIKAESVDLSKLEELTGRDMNQIYDLYSANGGSGISMQESTLLFAQLIANRVTGYPLELIEMFSARDSFWLKNRVYRFFFLEA